MNILAVNLLFSTLLFGIAARLYLMPAISRLGARSVVLPILLLHSMRHLGLTFLAPGAVFPGIPQQFTYPAALGDLIRAVLALIAIPAVIRSSPLARPLVGLFNVVGTLDLVDAISRHHLRRLAVHGACVLDTCLLGSGTPRLSLCCVCPSRSALVWADVSNLG
jgi:hypothetical protein